MALVNANYTLRQELRAHDEDVSAVIISFPRAFTLLVRVNTDDLQALEVPKNITGSVSMCRSEHCVFVNWES
jgi:hypothetical protein